MTRKHFEAFAEEIGKMIGEDPKGAGVAAVVMIRVAQKFNPNFDVSRFQDAVAKVHFEETD